MRQRMGKTGKNAATCRQYGVKPNTHKGRRVMDTLIFRLFYFRRSRNARPKQPEPQVDACDSSGSGKYADNCLETSRNNYQYY